MPLVLSAQRKERLVKYTAVGDGGGGGGGADTLLGTITVPNTSGSTVATNFITPSFGLEVKKGDVTSSRYIKFTLTDGTTVCPYTAGPKTTWTDGSLKFLPVMCGVRVPTTIAGSGTLTLNVYASDTAPSTSSSRTTADLTAAGDLTLEATGIDNLSGTITASLNYAIANGTVKEIASGPTGKIWRITGPYRTTAPADHGQMRAEWYAAALTDASDGVYGVRVLPRTVNGYYDVDSPAKIKRGFTLAFKIGGSTTGLTQPSAGSAVTLTMSNGNEQIASTGHGLEAGTAGRLSGTVPSPYNNTTTYYIHKTDDNQVKLHPTGNEAIGNLNVIVPTANGSCTFTPHIELVHFASAWGANTTGTYQFIAGTRAAEATVRVLKSKTYQKSTRLVTPLDLTVIADAGTAYSYRPNGKAALRSNFQGGGLDGTYGTTFPVWAMRYLLGQSANDEQTVRTSALSLAHFPLSVRNSSTKTVPVLNAASGTPYTGMGTATSTMRWYPANSASVSGFTAPSGDLLGCINSSGTDHWPPAITIAWLMTGEPQYADLMAEAANHGVMVRSTSTRNYTISAVNYYGVTFGDDFQQRMDSGAYRLLAEAAGLLPDSHWDAAALRTYFTDMKQGAVDWILAYNATQNSFWQDNGIYFFKTDGDGSSATWQSNWMIEVAAHAYAVAEDADDKTFCEYLLKLPINIDANVGVIHWSAYQYRLCTSAANRTLISSLNDMHFALQVEWLGVSADAGTDLFTLDIYSRPNVVVITADDKVLFMESPPGNTSAGTSYFLRDVTDGGAASTSNKTHKIASTSGGAAINISSGVGALAYYRFQNTLATTGVGYAFVGADSYLAIGRAALRYGEAVGAANANLATVRGKIDTIFDRSSVNLAANPWLAYAASYS